MQSRRLELVFLSGIALVAIVALVGTPSRSEEQGEPAQDVILLASTARLAGAWRVMSITGAAGGTATVLPNTGRAKVTTALANPADYFELTFEVTANVPYRLWLRGRANGNSGANDSVHIQFSNSLDASGAAAWRIGTASAVLVNLEDCSGCGNSGWGWEDTGWGSVNALGPEIRFATDGQQTLRVQNREDGFYVDQVVLSASTYLTVAPGANKNDSTILIEPPPSSPEIVIHAASAAVTGAWQIVADAEAASGRAAVLPNANRAKAAAAKSNPTDYFEVTFTASANTPYRLWMRGRADGNASSNDSVFVQFSDSIDASGNAAWRIGTTSSVLINLEDCSGCGNAGWGWEDTGWGAVGALGPEIRFASTGTKTLRVQNREDGFFIDQIVLSASAYLTSAPGANKNDSTILDPDEPPPPATVTMVRYPYLQRVTDRSAIVVWATREPGPAEARVDGRTFAATTTLFPTSRTAFATNYYQHEAAVSGLDSATSYPYELRVRGVRAASGDAFRTAPATGAGVLRFIAFADTGIGSTAQRSLAARMTADTFDLAVHAGDIVYGSSSTSGDATYLTYQSWFFDIYRDWLKRKPFFPTMGNHDGRQTNNYGQAYLDLFVLPESAGAGAYPDHAERYYSFDYGPVHFVALDTERAFQPGRREAQLAWLADDLASTAQPWKVVYMHRSPYSSSPVHGSDLAVRQAFGPILEQHGVQLALTAHDHTYERTVPWRESTNPSRQAVTYIVIGGGGARLYSTSMAGWTAYSQSRYQYLRVTVDGCVLTTVAVDTAGATFDPFALDRCAQSLDAAAPTVRVTAPANGTTVSGVVSITAAATDDVRVEKVDFWIDGALRAIDRTASYSYSWDSRTVPAGAHTIEARAYDIDGSRVSSTRVTVTTTGS
jgi:hypothetical protein